MSPQHLSGRAAALLLLLLCGGLAFGLGFGLSGSAPLPETITTGTSTTGAPTTTPVPLVCPTCNASYELVYQLNTPRSDTTVWGQVVDYYVAGETFVILNASATSPYNLTLARVSKCTGEILWANTLCGLYSGFGPFLSIDQTNGNVYALYQCSGGPETFLEKYDTNGALLWTQNITMSLNLGNRTSSIESPITLNIERQHLYFTARSYEYMFCSYNMSNGVNLWCTRNDTQEWSSIAYDNSLGVIYVIASYMYGSNSAMHIFNETNGICIGSVSGAGYLDTMSGIDVDSYGNIYVWGVTSGFPDYNGTVRKYDNTLSIVWSSPMLLPNYTERMSYAYIMRDLLYDPIANLVIVCASPKNVATDKYQPFVAFFDGTTGTQTGFQTVSPSVSSNQFIAAIVPDYEQRTVYMSYQLQIYPLLNQILKAFCYYSLSSSSSSSAAAGGCSFFLVGGRPRFLAGAAAPSAAGAAAFLVFLGAGSFFSLGALGAAAVSSFSLRSRFFFSFSTGRLFSFLNVCKRNMAAS